ncbi:MAG: radical SAM family heme chaperone HemW [Candidatus Acidiferrales bacterium]
MSLGVYIQVPFCQTKCTYCNFHTGVVSRDRFQPYADAVCREIAETAASDAPAVDTMYFGGGTPSLLEPAALAKIIESVRGSYHFEPGEITLEADPETITGEKASAWVGGGFNRVSLGAQSFNDVELQAAGRMHRRADIFRAAEILRSAGFDNVSMDLIAGLAYQTRESWESSIAKLLTNRPEHISIYMLEIDEGSHLGKECLAGGSRYSAGAVPADEAMAEFYESACAKLSAAGYEHYEISNWALPGRRSRHNLKYWRREPYIGFGAGAHSFDGITRWANVHDSARYVACIEQSISPREQIERVTPEQAFEEEFFLGLRQLDGIDLDKIESAYAGTQHKRVVGLRNRIDGLRSQGFVEMDGARLRLAPDHLTISNDVFVELLS